MPPPKDCSTPPRANFSRRIEPVSRIIYGMGQHRPATEGWVYFIAAEGLDVIKIGFTTNMSQRMSDIQGHSPAKLRVIKQVKTTYKTEQTLLALFDEYRLHGEWFTAAPELLAFISKLSDGKEFSLAQIFVAGEFCL